MARDQNLYFASNQCSFISKFKIKRRRGKSEKKVEKPREDKLVVLKYVKLTGIYRKESRRRKATLINLGNKDDVTTLAISGIVEFSFCTSSYSLITARPASPSSVKPSALVSITTRWRSVPGY